MKWGRPTNSFGRPAPSVAARPWRPMSLRRARGLGGGGKPQRSAVPLARPARRPGPLDPHRIPGSSWRAILGPGGHHRNAEVWIKAPRRAGRTGPGGSSRRTRLFVPLETNKAASSGGPNQVCAHQQISMQRKPTSLAPEPKETPLRFATFSFAPRHLLVCLRPRGRSPRPPSHEDKGYRVENECQSENVPQSLGVAGPAPKPLCGNVQRRSAACPRKVNPGVGRMGPSASERTVTVLTSPAAAN
jgi:hypothetical protein